MTPSLQPSSHQLAVRAVRNTDEYRAARTAYRTHAEIHRLPCWLDGEPIDYSLPKDHPDSWSWDHAVPLSKGRTVAEVRALALDPGNFRSSHLACNKRRGNDDPHIPIGTPSRQW